MLEIDINISDMYNEKTNEFLTFKPIKLQLEHSLISVSKWESKWHVAFLGKEKSIPEIVDYIRCMTINKGVDDRIYQFIPSDKIVEIINYINDPMTATVFTKNAGLIGAQKKSSEAVTAELIYYWMITLNVPVEFEKWHLNKLLTLIKVINVKNTPPKKMSKKEAAMERARLNAERRAKYHSKG